MTRAERADYLQNVLDFQSDLPGAGMPDLSKFKSVLDETILELREPRTNSVFYSAKHKDAVETAIKNILQSQDFDCGDEILCSVIAEKCAKEVFRILLKERP